MNTVEETADEAKKDIGSGPPKSSKAGLQLASCVQIRATRDGIKTLNTPGAPDNTRLITEEKSYENAPGEGGPVNTD